MPQRIDLQILLRALIPLILLPLLGITPRARDLVLSQQSVRLASQASVAGGAAARRAADSLVRVAEYQPWRVELWQAAGMYALQSGDPKAASDYLERGERQGSLSAAGYLSLGDARWQLSDPHGALRAWQTARQAGAAPFEVYSRYLEAHQEQGDFQAVLADLQELAALRPVDVQLRYRLGLHMAAVQPEDALAHLAQAAELDPALKPQADALVSSIRTARRADDPAYTLLETGRALAAIGEWALAVEALQHAVDLRPGFADAWAYLGEARQRMPAANDQEEPGLAELQKALGLEPDSLVANTLLALYWQRSGNLDEAEKALSRIIEIYPDNPALLAELGNTLAQDGELESALSTYQAAVRLAPSQAGYWRLLAGFSAGYEYLVSEVGLPAARRAAALNPNDPANLDVLGQVLLLLRDFASAERFFRRSVQIDPAYAIGNVHLGLIYILKDERSRAREEWNRVLELAPGTPAADQAQRLLGNYFP